MHEYSTSVAIDLNIGLIMVYIRFANNVLIEQFIKTSKLNDKSDTIATHQKHKQQKHLSPNHRSSQFIHL